MIRIGNAPCSWGNLEWEDKSGALTYSRMLDELVEAGYTGSELGDWGFMPTDPAALKREFDARNLTMTGAFVPVDFRSEPGSAAGRELALRTARLIAHASPPHRPWIVLADDCPDAPQRMANAGRVTPELGLTRKQWVVYASNVNAVARAVNNETGLRCVFHHHTGGFVETPDEIERVLELTDPAIVSLVFDTGHYAFGTGAPGAAMVMDGLKRFAERIAYVHFKDCDPLVAAQSRLNGWDYHANVEHGIFCELGKGCVPFPDVLAWLRARNYDDFITVEQDVLPGMGAPRESAIRNRQYLAGIGLG